MDSYLKGTTDVCAVSTYRTDSIDVSISRFLEDYTGSTQTAGAV